MQVRLSIRPAIEESALDLKLTFSLALLFAAGSGRRNSLNVVAAGQFVLSPFCGWRFLEQLVWQSSLMIERKEAFWRERKGSESD